jgi:hypothetical protein
MNIPFAHDKSGHLTPAGVRQALAASSGHFVSLAFVKRTTGEVRHMVCRTGVKSHLRGGEPAYDAPAHGLVFVFDVQRNGYRSIPVDNVLWLRVNGRTYNGPMMAEVRSTQPG